MTGSEAVWMVCVKVLVSVSVFVLLWFAVKKIEPEYGSNKSLKVWKVSLAAAVIYMIVAAALQQQASMPEAILNSLFWASMALCAMSDYLTTEPYDFCYLPALVAGIGLCIINLSGTGAAGVWGLIAFGVFCLLQILIFREMYGWSDCLAYMMCSLFMTSAGKGFENYVLLMLYVHVAFTVVNLIQRNVTRKLELKVPKPLIPYIAVVMLVVMSVWR